MKKGNHEQRSREAAQAYGDAQRATGGRVPPWSGVLAAVWDIAHSLAAIADAVEGSGNGLAVDAVVRPPHRPTPHDAWEGR